MSTTSHYDERIAKMTFVSVYPHYVTKVENKGRSIEKLHQVIEWLTGYNNKKLEALIKDQVRYLDKLVDELARGRKMEKILRVT
ncbi:DUF2200 family protein [Pontimicrobium sp. MEBiC06410]